MKSTDFFFVFFFISAVVFFTSCDKLPFTKKKELPILDTIVDFTSVDLSPSFTICDSLVDKQKKSDCFRKTIHQKIGEELKKHELVSRDSINETIFVDILINSKGEIQFQNLKSSSTINEVLPQLDSLLKKSVNNLPKVYPAIKRGIPVTTKYQLPIQIVLEQ